MGRLDRKVVLISGGARGQGAAEAKLFAREGAQVVFGDVLDEEGHQVETEIRTAGGDATYVHLDVTSEDAWRAAVDLAETTYGQLNVLVNNAGIVIRKPIEETTEDDLDRILAVNLKGVFLGTKHAIPAMRRAGGGSIINSNSRSVLKLLYDLCRSPLSEPFDDSFVAVDARCTIGINARLGTKQIEVSIRA